ncbi:hypothetical protein [Sphingomonas radiodurans]|uniref:hypothetical protein n=1 Tax=Sphingomonas radiodurans TaxID=2890321 RepID=UPI001E55B87A|nr:hypothetical protein [Sphingomonas radiodurans]WBH17203.1 hypothetical protein LLW23_03550 [Sphingomonas radiodurans]
MRIFLAAALAATTLTAVPVAAQSGAQREYREDMRDARQERNRDLRNADSRRDVREARQEFREDRRDARQDWRQDRRRFGNYDYNRLPPGQRAYYADNFYVAGANYRPRRLTRNDRIYRGNNGRYYCRRSDGTTGLIIGGIGGGLAGGLLTNGRSNTLGVLAGAGIGAVLGRTIDRGQVVCR